MIESRMMKSLVMVTLTMSIGSVAAAAKTQDSAPERVTIELTKAYIPGGFDSNDRAQFVVEGYLPNTCYRVGPFEKTLDQTTKVLTIRQTAYRYKGICLMVLVPFSETIQVGILTANNYKVQDGYSGKELGNLSVRAATNVGPDDHLYAGVTDAYVGVVDGGFRSIILQGELPNDCWRIKEKRVFLDGKNVIVVLPIMEQFRTSGCSDARVPFVSAADVPNVEAGRYLLHVRSLNGLAVNKLVDL